MYSSASSINWQVSKMSMGKLIWLVTQQIPTVDPLQHQFEEVGGRALDFDDVGVVFQQI